jgi:AraC family transcriptional regulator
MTILVPSRLADTALHDRLDPGQNFGAMTHAVQENDLLVNAADHTPGMVVPHHVHANAYLCIVVAGSFELNARMSQDCTAGSVIAHPEGHGHANRFSDQPGRCVNIHFGSTWTAQRTVRDWLADYRHARLGAQAPSLRRLALEMCAQDEAASLAVASAAIELLAEAMRAGAAPNSAKWMQRIVDRIESDLANAPSLGELAREVGVHPAHVSRAFRKAHGETIGEYVRRRRVEQAARSLADPSLSLADIAAAAGFSDQAHFTRVFRQHFGVSPGARRREMQLSF